MARFIADIKGTRGEASRLGDKNSGIRGHIRGWNLGVKVEGYVDENGKDHFLVWKTSGSNGNGSSKLIGDFAEGEEGT